MKKTFYLFGLIFLTACISSCDVIHFNRFPGTAQDTIPNALRGQYELIVKQGNKEKPDTLTVYIGKNSFTQIDKEEVQIKFLNDSMVFSVFEKNYFLSERESNLWTSNLIKVEGKNLKLFLIEINEKEDADKIAKLKKYFPNVRIQQLENKKIIVAEMNEAKLVKFVSKELKKKGLKLKRVEE